MNKRIAFTLAEVLITLGIIGVVAAMTIPTVMQKHREKTTISKIMKANSVLAQIYLLAQSDNGAFNFSAEPQQSEVEDFYNNYWKRYIKISKECTTYQDCLYPEAKPFYYANGNNQGRYLIYNGRKSFIASDGTLYFVIVFTIPTANTPVYRHTIYIDLNAGNPPNTFGKDIFVFQYITDKTVFPYGYLESDSVINENCSKTGTGMYCAEKIRRNGWKIPADYPFKL